MIFHDLLMRCGNVVLTPVMIPFGLGGGMDGPFHDPVLDSITSLYRRDEFRAVGLPAADDNFDPRFLCLHLMFDPPRTSRYMHMVISVTMILCSISSIPGLVNPNSGREGRTSVLQYPHDVLDDGRNGNT